MNAMDIYDFDEGGPATPVTASASNATASTSTGAKSTITEQNSLNEEMQQALGSLGSWWGGFRKQSVVALASARKDLGQVVQQAQREIGKLATSPPMSPRASTSTSEPVPSDTAAKTLDTSADTVVDPDATITGATSAELEEDAAVRSGATSSSPTSTNSLFSFLPINIAQNLTAAPTNIQTTFQRTLANPEIQNLRSSITTNLSTFQSTVQSSVSTVQSTVQSGVQSVQSNPQVQSLASSVQSLPSSVGGLNVKAVEGFVIEKGEEFWKGAGEFFREAVKIVPPSEEELVARGMGIGVGAGVFDGAGVWVFDDLGGGGDADDVGETDGGEGKGEAVATAGVAVSRTAALLKQLRGEPALLRVDPLEGGEEGKDAETFQWFLHELEGKGISVGSEAWLSKGQSEEGMFEKLKVTRELLVPSEMDEATFWKRYWFRAWQVREAEEKRRAVLQGKHSFHSRWRLFKDDINTVSPPTATTVLQKEDDFAWEDEEEDTAADRTETQTPLNNSTHTLGVKIPDTDPSSTSAEMKTGEPDTDSGGKKSGISAGSPRESSEDSYDLVSTRSGNASGTALAVPALASVLETKEGEERRRSKEEKGNGEEDSGDSDWE